MNIFNKIREARQRSQRVKAETIKARNLYEETYMTEIKDKIKKDTINKAIADANRPRGIKENIQAVRKFVKDRKETTAKAQSQAKGIKKEIVKNILPSKKENIFTKTSNGEAFNKVGNSNPFSGGTGQNYFSNNNKRGKNFWE